MTMTWTSLKPLPYRDRDSEVVYTSHTIEHITEEAVRVLFAEAYRVACGRDRAASCVTTWPQAWTAATRP